MIEVATSLLILIGVVFSFLGSFGLVRFPDFYSRVHAASKSSTAGIIGILVGTFVFFAVKDQIISMKVLLGIAFVFLTSPVGSQMIVRAAHRTGVPLWEYSVRDDLKQTYHKENS